MNQTTQMTIAASIVALGMVVTGFLASGNASFGSDGSKTFKVVMENNRYKPAEIVAKVGDQVVIEIENRDPVAHGVSLPQFNATVPGGHVRPGETVQLSFVADRAISTDAAVCGGANPTDTTDDHGEELIVRVI